MARHAASDPPPRAMLSCAEAVTDLHIRFHDCLAAIDQLPGFQKKKGGLRTRMLARADQKLRPSPAVAAAWQSSK